MPASFVTVSRALSNISSLRLPSEPKRKTKTKSVKTFQCVVILRPRRHPRTPPAGRRTQTKANL
jgi:hypothetical protein